MAENGDPSAALSKAARVLERLGSGEVQLEAGMRRAVVPVTGGARLLAAVVRELDAADIELEDFGVRRPTLDDVFLTLTGHTARQEAAPEEPQSPDRVQKDPATDKEGREGA